MPWFAGTTAATAATASCCATTGTQSDLTPLGAMASTNGSFSPLGILLLLPGKGKPHAAFKTKPPNGVRSPDSFAWCGPGRLGKLSGVRPVADLHYSATKHAC
jgi:hypothetical protein